jgi:cell division protease FtsH
MSTSDQIKVIKQKQRKLLHASSELKKHFIGLDSIIDRVISDIEVWYMMPDLITRPVVICLWGMTGVGKTDFVKRLVDLLDYKDKYEEIQLLNNGYNRKISEKLSASNIDTCEPGILLLDEIQRFRSVNNQGEDIHEYQYQDVWDLLSDGYLSSNSDREFMLEMMYDAKREIRDNKSGSKKKAAKQDDPFEDDLLADDFWNVKRFKSILKLTETMEEISSWSRKQKLNKVSAKLEDKSVFNDDDYTKLLIFISGNLDEAFSMASGVDDMNLDADIYHDYSKQISMIDIKKALKERFKPEQISRFGNIHIIYPSLSRASYESIIAREVDKIALRLESQINMVIEIDPSINKLIYDNGVFPVQGVRPVFSSISEILENSIPTFALQALMQNIDKFKLSYKDGAIKAKIGSKTNKVPYVGEIDSIKNKRRKNKDFISLLAVHEAGHALIYGVEYGVAPTQIAVDVASSIDGADAFVGCHDNGGTKNFLKKHIRVCLGGLVAEKLVFGEDGRGSGVGSDLVQATSAAGEMIRNCAMGDTISYIVPYDSPHAETCNTDIDETNFAIEAILVKAQKKSRKIIKKNLPLFFDIVDRLTVKGQMKPEEFKEVCSGYDLDVRVVPNSEVLDEEYLKMYEAFKDDNNA